MDGDRAIARPVMARDRIAVIGLWHLGSVSVAGWAAIGHHVTAWDPDPGLRDAMRAGRAPVAEPGLDDLLTSAIAGGRLAVVDQVAEAVAGHAVIHVAFDSRVNDRGAVEDDRIQAAADAVADAGPPSCLLLLSSQVPVGTGDRLRHRLAEAGRPDVLFAYLLENLRLGSAVADFLQPSRVVVGTGDDASWNAAQSALEGIGGPDPIWMNVPAAELVKHATNAYLALCITFANEISAVAAAHGANAAHVMEALRTDPRVSPKAPLRPGAAFSGATLRRDLVTLADTDFGTPNLFADVLAINDRHALRVLDLLRAEFGSLAGLRLAVLGLAYKPGTSTLRDSLPLRLVRRMAQEGAAEIHGYDPMAEPVPDPPRGFVRAATLAGCIARADAVVVLSGLPDVADLAWLDLPSQGRIIVDGCGALDCARVRAAGWQCVGLSSARRQ